MVLIAIATSAIGGCALDASELEDDDVGGAREDLTIASGPYGLRFEALSGEQVIAVHAQRNAAFDGVHIGRGDYFDSPPRAYIDGGGRTNLVSGNHPTFRFLGSALGPGMARVGPGLESAYDPNPYAHNDASWVWSTWVRPGNGDRNLVAALMHHEYHANDPFVAQGAARDVYEAAMGAQPYFSTTYAESADNGDHYGRGGIVANTIDGNVDGARFGEGGYPTRWGLSEPSSIVRADDGYYYALVRTHVDRVDGGVSYPTASACVIRNRDLRNWQAWEIRVPGGWSGAAAAQAPDCQPLTIRRPDGTLVDPYHSLAAINPHSLTYNTYLRKFVAFGGMHVAGTEKGLAMLVSDDLETWTGPFTVFTSNRAAPTTGGFHAEMWDDAEPIWHVYSTLLDHDDAGQRDPDFASDDERDLNFARTDREAWVYFVQLTNATNTREIHRIKIRFDYQPTQNDLQTLTATYGQLVERAPTQAEIDAGLASLVASAGDLPALRAQIAANVRAESLARIRALSTEYFGRESSDTPAVEAQLAYLDRGGSIADIRRMFDAILSGWLQLTGRGPQAFSYIYVDAEMTSWLIPGAGQTLDSNIAQFRTRLADAIRYTHSLDAIRSASVAFFGRTSSNTPAVEAQLSYLRNGGTISGIHAMYLAIRNGWIELTAAPPDITAVDAEMTYWLLPNPAIYTNMQTAVATFRSMLADALRYSASLTAIRVQSNAVFGRISANTPVVEMELTYLRNGGSIAGIRRMFDAIKSGWIANTGAPPSSYDYVDAEMQYWILPHATVQTNLTATLADFRARLDAAI